MSEEPKKQDPEQIRRKARQKSVQGVKRESPITQAPDWMKADVEKAWAEDGKLQRMSRDVEEGEKEVHKAEKNLAEAKQTLKNKEKVLREKRIALRVLKAKRNTHKNKIYRNVEKKLITEIKRAVHKDMGIVQTWADPKMKRELQRGDINSKRKAGRGADEIL